eukprot:11636005-Prorocentrum_lima.AAC.1
MQRRNPRKGSDRTIVTMPRSVQKGPLLQSAAVHSKAPYGVQSTPDMARNLLREIAPYFGADSHMSAL